MTGTMDAKWHWRLRTCRPSAYGVYRLIPDFIDGVLPEGVHPCTLDELADRFGRSLGSDRRSRLTDALKRYASEVRALGVASALLIDGSYVTIKSRPNDIDLILILREDLDLKPESTPAEYNVRSMRMVRKKYGFDVRAVREDSPDYADYLQFFSRVRGDDSDLKTNRTTKGLLRIEL